MPQTADREHDQHIYVLSRFAAAVAAERDIQIIPEPR